MIESPNEWAGQMSTLVLLISRPLGLVALMSVFMSRSKSMSEVENHGHVYTWRVQCLQFVLHGFSLLIVVYIVVFVVFAPLTDDVVPVKLLVTVRVRIETVDDLQEIMDERFIIVLVLSGGPRVVELPERRGTCRAVFVVVSADAVLCENSRVELRLTDAGRRGCIRTCQTSCPKPREPP